jgi:hypothetical protein
MKSDTLIWHILWTVFDAVWLVVSLVMLFRGNWYCVFPFGFFLWRTVYHSVQAHRLT